MALSFTGCLNPSRVVDGPTELRRKLPAAVALWAGGSAPVLVWRAVSGVLPLALLQELPAALHHWRAGAVSRPRDARSLLA